ncbi:MAG: serpin family protein [Thermoplasmata archaeon]
MSLKTALFAILVCGVLLTAGATYTFLRPQARTGKAPAGPAEPENDLPSPANLQELVNASNRFALELYAGLSNGGENIFFSPYSIFTALGMTYEGARNRTAEEIRAVLHLPADNQTRWSLFKALIERLSAGGAGCNLSTANAMWIQRDFNILSDYVNTVQTYYRASAFSVDYARAAEEARQRINSWVEDQTGGRIKDLIPQGILNPLTRLVLTNAIYFRGDWLKRFNESLTEEKDFHPRPGESVRVDMMARKDEKSVFNYTSVDGIQILEMPYAGGKLSMLVLLPGPGEMEGLEAKLSPRKLEEWRSKLRERRVDVFFPKFRLERRYFLNDNLSRMGMPTAFSMDSDFSGIDGAQDLYIAAVIHQAFVSVDERGTEAAGATAVVIEYRNAPVEPAVPVFNADHPFVFIIQDRETGSILFMGKVVDPTK